MAWNAHAERFRYAVSRFRSAYHAGATFRADFSPATLEDFLSRGHPAPLAGPLLQRVGSADGVPGGARTRRQRDTFRPHRGRRRARRSHVRDRGRGRPQGPAARLARLSCGKPHGRSRGAMPCPTSRLSGESATGWTKFCTILRVVSSSSRTDFLGSLPGKSHRSRRGTWVSKALSKRMQSAVPNCPGRRQRPKMTAVGNNLGEISLYRIVAGGGRGG